MASTAPLIDTRGALPGAAVGAPQGPHRDGAAPVKLSFTRFVAMHGGAESLRSSLRAQTSPQPDLHADGACQLTFHANRIGSEPTPEPWSCAWHADMNVRLN